MQAFCLGTKTWYILTILQKVILHDCHLSTTQIIFLMTAHFSRFIYVYILRSLVGVLREQLLLCTCVITVMNAELAHMVATLEEKLLGR